MCSIIGRTHRLVTVRIGACSMTAALLTAAAGGSCGRASSVKFAAWQLLGCCELSLLAIERLCRTQAWLACTSGPLRQSSEEGITSRLS